MRTGTGNPEAVLLQKADAILTKASDALQASEGDLLRVKGIAADLQWLGERLQAVVDALGTQISNLQGLYNEVEGVWIGSENDQQSINDLAVSLDNFQDGIQAKINSIYELL